MGPKQNTSKVFAIACLVAEESDWEGYDAPMGGARGQRPSGEVSLLSRSPEAVDAILDERAPGLRGASDAGKSEALPKVGEALRKLFRVAKEVGGNFGADRADFVMERGELWMRELGPETARAAACWAACMAGKPGGRFAKVVRGMSAGGRARAVLDMMGAAPTEQVARLGRRALERGIVSAAGLFGKGAAGSSAVDEALDELGTEDATWVGEEPTAKQKTLWSMLAADWWPLAESAEARAWRRLNGYGALSLPDIAAAFGGWELADRLAASGHAESEIEWVVPGSEGAEEGEAPTRALQAMASAGLGRTLRSDKKGPAFDRVERALGAASGAIGRWALRAPDPMAELELLVACAYPGHLLKGGARYVRGAEAHIEPWALTLRARVEAEVLARAVPGPGGDGALGARRAPRL